VKRFIIAVACIVPAIVVASQYTPTCGYAHKEILGWQVLVNREFTAEHPALAEKVLRLLESHLYQICRVVPEAALVHLRKQKIWVEYKDRNFPCMCYHPSAEWLSKNGYNPAKAGGIEICGAEKFLSWTKDQPWMVLHELAHGYHHKVIGYDNAELNAAFRNAKESGNYNAVLHINGRTQKAYAMNNAKEYFAETAEAFFGTNDFYPFVRAELKQHDPEVFRLHRKFWSRPPTDGEQ